MCDCAERLPCALGRGEGRAGHFLMRSTQKPGYQQSESSRGSSGHACWTKGLAVTRGEAGDKGPLLTWRGFSFWPLLASDHGSQRLCHPQSLESQRLQWESLQHQEWESWKLRQAVMKREGSGEGVGVPRLQVLPPGISSGSSSVRREWLCACSGTGNGCHQESCPHPCSWRGW